MQDAVFWSAFLQRDVVVLKCRCGGRAIVSAPTHEELRKYQLCTTKTSCCLAVFQCGCGKRILATRYAPPRNWLDRGHDYRHGGDVTGWPEPLRMLGEQPVYVHEPILEFETCILCLCGGVAQKVMFAGGPTAIGYRVLLDLPEGSDRFATFNCGRCGRRLIAKIHSQPPAPPPPAPPPRANGVRFNAEGGFQTTHAGVDLGTATRLELPYIPREPDPPVRTKVVTFIAAARVHENYGYTLRHNVTNAEIVAHFSRTATPWNAFDSGNLTRTAIASESVLYRVDKIDRAVARLSRLLPRAERVLKLFETVLEPVAKDVLERQKNRQEPEGD